MKAINLTISEINRLNTIKIKLTQNVPLELGESEFLSKFISQLPVNEYSLAENIEPDEKFVVQAWEDMNKLEHNLENWKNLFCNIPGYDYVSSWLVSNEEVKLLNQQIIITVCFAPSMAYNSSHLDGYYIRLKDDGTAKFWFPSFEDAEQYPELYNFKGSWKEAYLLLIETLKKGWPMEEFPEELQKFLPKN